MKCLRDDCSEPLVRWADQTETCVGYFSPPGHDHDNNCLLRYYYCAAGHCWKLSLRRSCPAPGCDWRGYEFCGCHWGPEQRLGRDGRVEYAKLPEWPVIEGLRSGVGGA